MSETSAIEWTSSTWNAVVGCSQVSEGCRHCYAEGLDRRFRLKQEGVEYRPWTHPNAGHNVRVFPDRLELPLKWKAPRRIFVNSRSDMFHEQIPPGFRDRMWSVMKEANRHTFQILTKRPENIPFMLPKDWGNGYPNVWLGVSVESRAQGSRVDLLLDEIPARTHFLSCEPLLGPVGWDTTEVPDWVIAGGESGPGHRPLELDWLRGIRDYCTQHDVPFFLKQLGGHPDKRANEKAVLDGRLWKEMPT